MLNYDTPQGLRFVSDNQDMQCVALWEDLELHIYYPLWPTRGWLQRPSSPGDCSNLQTALQVWISMQNQKTPHLSSLGFSPAMCHHQTLQMPLQYFMQVIFPQLSPFSHSFSEFLLYDPALIWKCQKNRSSNQARFYHFWPEYKHLSCMTDTFLFIKPIASLISSRSSWFIIHTNPKNNS